MQVIRKGCIPVMFGTLPLLSVVNRDSLSRGRRTRIADVTGSILNLAFAATNKNVNAVLKKVKTEIVEMERLQ